MSHFRRVIKLTQEENKTNFHNFDSILDYVGRGKMSKAALASDGNSEANRRKYFGYLLIP